MAKQAAKKATTAVAMAITKVVKDAVVPDSGKRNMQKDVDSASKTGRIATPPSHLCSPIKCTVNFTLHVTHASESAAQNAG